MRHIATCRHAQQKTEKSQGHHVVRKYSGVHAPLGDGPPQLAREPPKGGFLCACPCARTDSRRIVGRTVVRNGKVRPHRHHSVRSGQRGAGRSRSLTRVVCQATATVRCHSSIPALHALTGYLATCQVQWFGTIQRHDKNLAPQGDARKYNAVPTCILYGASMTATMETRRVLLMSHAT